MRLSVRQHVRTFALGLSLVALPLLAARATAQGNYTLPPQPTAHVGNNYFYAVPIGYTWDHLSYSTNFGNWNIAIGDSGFDAGEIPGNPLSCGPNGDNCPADAGPKGPSFITTNNDPLHGYTGIPLLIGPTQDDFNNVIIGSGQAIPVVPGKYKALYIAYAAVNGPHTRPVVLNYTDGLQIINAKWADWCAASQAPPDFFSWAAKHRNGTSAADNNSCALITKYIPVNPNRTLTSVTLEYDQNEASTAVPGVTSGMNGGGQELPGDTVTGGNSRTVIGCITLVSDDPNLGGYGLVRGTVKDSSGAVLETPVHDATVQTGADVFVLDPPMGLLATGVNVDGTYTLGLPAGTYTLSVAVRGGTDQPTSLGPQATPVQVTVTAGQTTTQDFTLSADPKPELWGNLTGTVKDASGAAVKDAAIQISSSADGPFAAIGLAGQGLTQADGAYSLRGLRAGTLYVRASTNGAASKQAVQVTIKGEDTVTQDLVVEPLPIGNVLGTIVAPDGTFGGIGVPVVLTSKDGSVKLNTTSYADPLIAGNSHVPEDIETSTFNFDAVPAGEYTLTLPASAFQGKAADFPVTVTQGQTANPKLTLTFADWMEGTADTTFTDKLSGTSLDAKWKVQDIGAPTEPGSAKLEAAGLTVTADGAGWGINQVDDAFTYVYQSGVPQTDWVAYVDVLAIPTQGSGSTNVEIPDGQAGLMVRSAAMDPTDNTLPYARAAHFTTGVTNGHGIIAQGRVADGLTTFPLLEYSAGTNPTNANTPGTQPNLPVTLKIRKVGPTIAAYWSNDGGKTQRFTGAFLPQFDPAGTLLLGMATTSNTDGVTDTAQFTNFVFAPLAAAPPPPTGKLGDFDKNGSVNILDVLTALRAVAGLNPLTAEQQAVADVNADGKFNITDVVFILRKVAGLISKFPGEQ